MRLNMSMTLNQVNLYLNVGTVISPYSIVRCTLGTEFWVQKLRSYDKLSGNGQSYKGFVCKYVTAHCFFFDNKE